MWNLIKGLILLTLLISICQMNKSNNVEKLRSIDWVKVTKGLK